MPWAGTTNSKIDDTAIGKGVSSKKGFVAFLLFLPKPLSSIVPATGSHKTFNILDTPIKTVIIAASMPTYFARNIVKKVPTTSCPISLPKRPLA